MWTLALCVILPLAAVPADSDAVAEVKAMLEDYHRAAADADGDRLFGHLAADAVILGTAATERYTVAEARALFAPYLDRGQGWTTVATERHVYLSAEGTIAWFDEKLSREGLGEMRGTGVARRTEEGWRIVQYSTSFPVPNELARPLMEMIREQAAKTAE